MYVCIYIYIYTYMYLCICVYIMISIMFKLLYYHNTLYYSITYCITLHYTR